MFFIIATHGKHPSLINGIDHTAEHVHEVLKHDTDKKATFRAVLNFSKKLIRSPSQCGEDWVVPRLNRGTTESSLQSLALPWNYDRSGRWSIKLRDVLSRQIVTDFEIMTWLPKKCSKRGVVQLPVLYVKSVPPLEKFKWLACFSGLESLTRPISPTNSPSQNKPACTWKSILFLTTSSLPIFLWYASL